MISSRNGVFMEWTVENLEGSKWNSSNIIGGSNMNDCGFDIRTSDLDDPESDPIATELRSVSISRTKLEVEIGDTILKHFKLFLPSFDARLKKQADDVSIVVKEYTVHEMVIVKEIAPIIVTLAMIFCVSYSSSSRVGEEDQVAEASEGRVSIEFV